MRVFRGIVVIGVVLAAGLHAAAQTPLPAAESRCTVALENATGALKARFSRAPADRPGTLTIAPVALDGENQSKWEIESNAPDAQERRWGNARVSLSVAPISPRATAFEWAARDAAVHEFVISIEDNSAYYGGGERFSSLNHKGQILPIASIDRPEDKGSVSYKPVPFYMSTRGYAVWLDSAAPATFDFNATERERVLIRCRAARVRLVLLDGPEFAPLLAEFTRLTGRPRVPPAWSFAPWKSRNVHNNREEVLADAELTRKHDLPGSVIVIDSPWETGYNDFVLNERQFARPAEMFARLRELGFYPCLWLTPFVNVENLVDMAGIERGECRNFAEAARSGFLVRRPDGSPMIASWWKGRGGLVDFTNPDAVKWWHAQIGQAQQWGLRALKCDDGEGNFVQDAVFFDGTSAAEMKNRYAALYLKAAQEYLDAQVGGDGVLLARCGFTGTQQQPFCWAGDNAATFSFENGLPSVVLAGENAALSGIPFWGHDIAGYQGTQTKEIFARWTQFGAFSPLMQVHMTSNLGPWDFDAETLAIYRKFAKLHTALFPYIFDAALEAARSGMPIIRPMVLAFPGDAAAALERYQYMFGPDLLVAPMIQPGEHRAVYLPRSGDSVASALEWVDFWSGKGHAGGKTIEVHAPLDRMPLFVRAGAVICMLPEDIDTLIPRSVEMAASVRTVDDRRIVAIWPGTAGKLRTFEELQVEPLAEGKAGVMLRSRVNFKVEVRRMFAECGGATTDRAGEGWSAGGDGTFLRRVVEVGAAGAEVLW